MRISDWSSDVCSSDLGAALCRQLSEPRRLVSIARNKPHPRAKTRGYAERSRDSVITQFSLRSNEPLVFARGMRTRFNAYRLNRHRHPSEKENDVIAARRNGLATGRQIGRAHV